MLACVLAFCMIFFSWLSVPLTDSGKYAFKVMFIMGYPLCFLGMISLEKYGAQIRYTALFKVFLRQLQDALSNNVDITSKSNFIIFKQLQQEEPFLFLFVVTIVLFVLMSLMFVLIKNKYILFFTTPVLSVCVIYIFSLATPHFINSVYNRKMLPFASQIYDSILSHSANETNINSTNIVLAKTIKQLSLPYKNKEYLHTRLRAFIIELQPDYTQKQALRHEL